MVTGSRLERFALLLARQRKCVTLRLCRPCRELDLESVSVDKHDRFDVLRLSARI